MRMGTPAGRPSTVTTNAGPGDSPAVRNRNTVPPGTKAPQAPPSRRSGREILRQTPRGQLFSQLFDTPGGEVAPPEAGDEAGVVAVPVEPVAVLPAGGAT